MVYNKEYYQKNKERINKQANEWNKKHRKQINEARKILRKGRGKENYKKQKKKEDAKYHARKKNDPEYLRKRREAATEYNNRPEVKEHRKKIQFLHRSKPEVKKYNQQYNQQWHKDNPEKQLASNKRQLQKLGDIHNMTWVKLLHHLRGWAKIIHQDCNETCQVCKSPSAEAHHIFHKKDYPMLAFNRNNGIALCIRCHNQVHGKRLLESVV